MLPPMDDAFGPALRNGFDFTLKFEFSIFEILPACIMVLATPWFVSAIVRKTNKVRRGVLLGAKLVVGMAFVALSLANVICWHQAAMYRSATTLAATILSLIASLCTLPILYAAHVKHVKPSALLSLFLSLTLLLDAATARSCLQRQNLKTVGSIYIAMAAVKFILALLEEIPKRNLLVTEKLRNDTAAADVSGFWTRALLIWVAPVLLRGFRGNFEVDDLPHIGQKFSTDELFRRFQPHWEQVDKKSKLPLLKPLLRTLAWELTVPIFPRLCFIGFSFSRPFLIQRVMALVSSGAPSTEVVNAIIGAAILVFGGIMVSRSVYARLEYQVKVCARGILIISIYDKLQRLGVDKLADSAAVTLMSADVGGFQQAMVIFHSTWASLLELGLGIYVLYRFVGYACFLIFIPTIIASVASYITTKKMTEARMAWNDKIQSRVAFTSNFLAQLKIIKAMGLSNALSKHLQQQRTEEVKISMYERYARVGVYVIYAFGNGITPVVIFAGARFWTRASNPMTTPEIFAAYSAIFIASIPLTTLLGYLPFYGSGYACYKRIQTFLTLEEICDQREVLAPSSVWSDKAGEKSASASPADSAIELHDVSMLNAASKPILKDVNLSISAGSVNMMHGTVGSGKSAFLKILLGELAPSAGCVRVASKRMAYAPQTPWIQNMTVRENVICGNDFDEALYQDVIKACALDKDILDWKDGDQTMTGSNGSNLSGGQKQRLGLARTLFTHAATFILDDVFSALDTKTTAAVFENLFGSAGLFRKWNSTVIMTTNKLELLRAATTVLEIGNDGAVLMKRNPGDSINITAIAEELRQSSSELERSEESPPEKTELPSVDTSKPSPKSAKAPSADRRVGDWKLYVYFFRSSSVVILFLWLFFTAISAAMERIPQIFMRIWQSTEPNNDSWFAGFALLSFGEIILTAGTGAVFLLYIVPKSSTELHWELLQTVVHSTLPFISRTDAGSLLTRFSEDIGSISQMLPLFILASVSMGFNVLVDIGIVASGAKYAPPLVVFLLLILYGIQYFYLHTSRQLRLMEVEASVPIYTLFTEAAAGMPFIRGLGYEKKFDEKLATHLNQSQKPAYFLLSVQQWLMFMLDFTTFVAAAVLISIALVFPSSSSDSAIGLALLNLITFSATANLFIQVWVQVETNLGSLARIKVFCSDTPQEDDSAAGAVPGNWPETGKIEFKGVTASYIGSNDEVHEALDNTSVVIEHGKKVGLSGRTGSGKSSMLLALLHLMEYSGRIEIDGKDIKTIPRELLRSRITTLTQDGVELKGTIRLNLYPYDTETTPTDDEMIASLKRVSLWDYIKQQGGLDANIAEARLSPGQMQLLFLARATLHQQTARTKIVLVDEATSSLDYAADVKVNDIMRDLFADCTMLIIAHRKEALKGVDILLELDNGQVRDISHTRESSLDHVDPSLKKGYHLS